MKRRSLIALALASCVVALALLCFGICYRVEHRGEGPRHTYPLPGTAALTDEQAIMLAKRTLQLDNRFSEGMELETFGDRSAVNRGDDRSYVSLSWWDPTRGRWYVQLHRKPVQV